MNSNEHEPFTDKWFSKEEKEMLLELFRMYAPSGQEECVADFVESQLIKLGLNYTRDTNNNIYNFDNTDKPLLSAHMDCVGKEECGWYVNFVNIFPYGKDEIMKGMGNIGGDDKCGVFLILLLLKEHPDYNFCFSVSEEVGGANGIKSIDFKKMKEDGITEKIPYAFILDRRNMGDIICVQNSYGSKEFDDALSLVGKEYGFKSERGSVSDANTISEYINCANLSVGYHNAHTKTEFVSLMGMKNTLNYVKACCEYLKGKEFKVEAKPVYTVPSTTYYDDYENRYERGYDRYNYTQNYCHRCKSYVKSSEFNFTKRLCHECEKDEQKISDIKEYAEINDIEELVGLTEFYQD